MSSPSPEIQITVDDTPGDFRLILKLRQIAKEPSIPRSSIQIATIWAMNEAFNETPDGIVPVNGKFFRPHKRTQLYAEGSPYGKPKLTYEKALYAARALGEYITWHDPYATAAEVYQLGGMRPERLGIFCVLYDAPI